MHQVPNSKPLTPSIVHYYYTAFYPPHCYTPLLYPICYTHCYTHGYPSSDYIAAQHHRVTARSPSLVGILLTYVP